MLSIESDIALYDRNAIDLVRFQFVFDTVLVLEEVPPQRPVAYLRLLKLAISRSTRGVALRCVPSFVRSMNSAILCAPFWQSA